MRRAGFTLTELLVVMAIVVLMTGLAMPYMMGGLRRERLRAAARYTVALVGLARARAVNLHTPTRVVFDLEGGAMWVQVRPRVEQEERLVLGPWQDLRTSEFTRRQLPAGVRIAEVSFLDADQTRYAEGTPAETADELPAGVVTLKLMPNGTAEPKQILLINEDDERILVRIDRLTGTPRVLAGDELDEGELLSLESEAAKG